MGRTQTVRINHRPYSSDAAQDDGERKAGKRQARAQRGRDPDQT